MSGEIKLSLKINDLRKVFPFYWLLLAQEVTGYISELCGDLCVGVNIVGGNAIQVTQVT